MFYRQGGVYYLSGYAFATNAEDGTLSRGQKVDGAWLLWVAGIVNLWVVVRYVIIVKLCCVTAFTSTCCAMSKEKWTVMEWLMGGREEYGGGGSSWKAAARVALHFLHTSRYNDLSLVTAIRCASAAFITCKFVSTV